MSSLGDEVLGIGTWGFGVFRSRCICVGFPPIGKQSAVEVIIEYVMMEGSSFLNISFFQYSNVVGRMPVGRLFDVPSRHV